MSPFASAFLPMRIVAEATIADHGRAPGPRSVALTQVTSPCAAYSHDRPSITKKLGQHEHHAGDEAAAHLVQEPPDVDRELLRLGTGQQHAVVQRVQEPAVRDPAPALDDLVVHDRDLPGRARRS